MASELVGIGSNLGDRVATLDRAIQLLGAAEQIRVLKSSRWIGTWPIGQAKGAPEFLNGAALLDTMLPPEVLLVELQSIENQLGRQRIDRWEPRTIDLDLLLYDDLIIRTPTLELPHPRMSFRRFVLVPAAEIAGAMIHPGIGWTIDRLLAHLDSAFPYIATSGPHQSDNRRLAAAVSAKSGWKLLDFPDADTLLAPAGSTSLTHARAIEFLRWTAALVSGEHLASVGRTISSFWIDDVLSTANALFPGELEQVWMTIAPTIVPPKLLVDFGSPMDRGEEFRRRDVGPVLRLASVDLATAEIELLAAIEAMQ